MRRSDGHSRHGEEQVQRRGVGPASVNSFDEHSMQNGMTAAERSWRSVKNMSRASAPPWGHFYLALVC